MRRDVSEHCTEPKARLMRGKKMVKLATFNVRTISPKVLPSRRTIIKPSSKARNCRGGKWGDLEASKEIYMEHMAGYEKKISSKRESE